MVERGALQWLLRRDRLVLVVIIAMLWALAWAYLLTGAGMDGFGTMPTDGMPMGAAMEPMLSTPTASPALAFVIVLAMWWIMMVAMMLPGAAPAILLYQRVYDHAVARDAAQASAPAYVFAAGYLLVWLGFAVLAALGQSWLTARGQVTSELLALVDARAVGALLVVAGLYQLSPFKYACLAHCRSPAAYFSRHWRPGWMGALRLGMRHGAYCVGCCWALMLLLFVFGVMNMIWIALLSLFVFAEKLIPFGPAIGRLSGALLIALGVVGIALGVTGGLFR